MRSMSFSMAYPFPFGAPARRLGRGRPVLHGGRDLEGHQPLGGAGAGAPELHAAEVLRGLERRHEGRHLVDARGVAGEGDRPLLLVQLGEPHLLGRDGGELVEHADRAAAPGLEPVEHVQLLLERLLLLLDVADLADDPLELGDVVAGAGQLGLPGLEVGGPAALPEVVAHQAHQEQDHDEGELLLARLLLLRDPDWE
jgi:hypothetical protein